MMEKEERVVSTGSCLCGRIAWEAETPLDWVGHCHCSVCRRVGGGAFVTFGGVEEERARWLQGEDLVARFHSSAEGFRPYCPVCGSGVMSPPMGGMAYMPLGCLDGEPGVRPTVQFYVGSKAPWADVPEDGAECFDSAPEGSEIPVMPARPELPPRRSESYVRGSCQCGEVAFEARQPRALVNCHCSRCRKCRSAAFAANFFADAAGFSYLRGEDQVEVFKLPEADRFTVGFCRGCSSSLPFLTPGASLVILPGGSLDDEPTAVPAIHIFVASKAPWYEITDDLEQFEAYPPGFASSQDWVEALR